MSSCPNKNTKEYKEMVSVLGVELTHYIWDKNNSNPIQLASNGYTSKLFKDLLNFFNSDIVKTITTKSKIYSNAFREAFENSNLKDINGEPTIEYLKTNNYISSYIEEKISELFESNQKFANEIYEILGFKSKADVIIPIGTSGSGKSTFEITPQQKQQAQQLYFQYLNTIFPDSKVKDIVYHGTNNLESFDFFNKDLETIFFAEEEDYAFSYAQTNLNTYKLPNGEWKNPEKKYGVTIIRAIINSNNLLELRNLDHEKDTNIKTPYKYINSIKDEGSINTSLAKKYKQKYPNIDTIYGQELGYSDCYKPPYSYVVFKPEQIHILGSKQDIQGFKDFVKNTNEIQYNSKGEVLAPNGEVSKLFKDIEKLEGIISKEQALQLYKQTRSKEFKEWFDDSKVVDENGEPLMVYHGSKEQFDSFDKELLSQNTGSSLAKQGFFFTSNKELALKYGEITYPVFLNIDKISVLDEVNYPDKEGFVQDKLMEEIELSGDLIYAKQKGNNGAEIQFNLKSGKIIEYVAFNSSQIKSIFNQGTFSKENDHIYYQNNTDQSDEKYRASEQTIRDLAERMSDKIGIAFKFENDITKNYKGKLENGVAYINLAYATLDTPIHEILGHPIINVIKGEIKTPYFKYDVKDLSNDKMAPGKYMIEYSENFENYDVDFFDTKEEIDEFIKNKTKSYNTRENKLLYQNLLKELETGYGKEVLDRIKKDYKYKKIKQTVSSVNYSSQQKLLNEGYKLVNQDDNISPEYFYYEKDIPYTLEEQQEEALVQLLGEYSAGKIKEIPENEGLLAYLKQLWKEFSNFMKSLLLQKEVDINNLPDNMSLGDIADLLVYSNSNLILPGNYVEYRTPDDKIFKTYKEASKHISKLFSETKDIDLSDVKLGDSNIQIVKDIKDIKVNSFSGVEWDGFDIPFYAEKREGKWYINYTKEDIQKDFDNNREIESSDKTIINYYNIFLTNNTLHTFIEQNKQFEQSKEIIKIWKKENDIVYDPEEVYSRGRQFYHTIGAYVNSFDPVLMMQNYLAHLQDYERIKASGEEDAELIINGFTRTKDSRVSFESKDSDLRIVIYPKSEDIKWVTSIDAQSGITRQNRKNVSEIFGIEKNELAGIGQTKAPNTDSLKYVQSSLAEAIANEGKWKNQYKWTYNEIGLRLTGNNFRFEYDKNTPYAQKKMANKLNKLLDDKYGKIEEPKLSTNNPIQPKKTKKNTTTIDSVKKKILGVWYEQYGGTDFWQNIEDDYKEGIISKEAYEELKQQRSKKYISQASINTKKALLSNVLKKYQRILITSTVVNENSYKEYFQKVGNGSKDATSTIYHSRRNYVPKEPIYTPVNFDSTNNITDFANNNGFDSITNEFDKGSKDTYSFLFGAADEIGVEINPKIEKKAKNEDFTALEDSETLAFYNESTNTITLTSNYESLTKSEQTKILAHELLHALMLNKYNSLNEQEKLAFESELYDYLDSIKNNKELMSQKIIRTLLKRIEEGGIQELITYAFTDVEVATALNNIMIGGEQKETISFWTKLKQLILSVFSDDRTKLDELNEIMDDYLHISVTKVDSQKDNNIDSKYTPKPIDKNKLIHNTIKILDDLYTIDEEGKIYPFGDNDLMPRVQDKFEQSLSNELRQMKQKLIQDLQKSINKLKIKKRFVSDLKDKEDIDEKIAGLQLQIDNQNSLLTITFNDKTITAVNKFEKSLQKDIQLAEFLLSQDSIGHVMKLRELINYYKAIGTFELKQLHPIISDLKAFNEAMNTNPMLIALEESFLNAKLEFTRIENLLEIEIDKNISTLLVDNSNLASLVSDQEDISMWDMLMHNMATNTFSTDSAIPQMILEHTREQLEVHRGDALSIIKILDKLQPLVDKKLKSIKKQGIISTSFDLFFQKTKNNEKSGKLINMFSNEWFSNLSQNLKIDYQSKTLFEDLFNRNKWLIKNANIIDIRKLPEIQKKYKGTEFEEFFVNDPQYKLDLIANTSEQMYNEFIQDSIIKIEEFLKWKELKQSDVLNAYPSVDSIPEDINNNLTASIASRNPFFSSESFANGFASTIIEVNNKEMTLLPNIFYNQFIPKRNITNINPLTGESAKTNSEYYDSNFDIIKNDSVLYEYWETISSALKYINEAFSQNNMILPFNSIPAMEKLFIETLMDSEKKGGIGSRFKLAIKQFLTNIKNTFTTNLSKSINATDVQGINRNISDKRLSEYQIIKKRLNAEWISIDGKLNEDFKISDLNSIQLQFLAHIANVEPSLQAVTNYYGNKPIRFGKLASDLTNIKITQESSQDIPRIIRTALILASEYTARQEIEPLMNVLKDKYLSIKRKKEVTGEKSALATFIRTKLGSDKSEDTRENANKRFMFNYNKAVRGQFDKDIGNIFKGLKDINVEDKKHFKKFLYFLSTGKIFTKDDIKTHTELITLLNKLKAKLLDEGLSINDTIRNNNKLDYDIIKEVKKVDKDVSSLMTAYNTTLDELDSLGRNLSINTVINGIFNALIFKGLAYNLSASITNRLEGKFANMIIDSTGLYWTPGNIGEAELFVTKGFKKRLMPNSDFAKQWDILKHIMEDYRILQDASNELQKNSVKSTFKHLDKLSPYAISVSSIEFKNQGADVIAILMDTEIKDDNGIVHKMFENDHFVAFDIVDGNLRLKDGFRKNNENIENWENIKGKQYLGFKNTVVQAISAIHGDYENLGGMLLKSSVVGKMVGMFKTWLPMQIWQRLAIQQNIGGKTNKQFKGRWRSLTPVSGAALGSLSGAILGPAGFILGGAIGAGLASLNKVDHELGFVKELILVSKSILVKSLFTPLHLFGIATKYGKPNLDSMNLSRIDEMNLKANISEMSLILGMILFKLFLSSLRGDDDDDDKDKKLKYGAYLFLENKTMNILNNFTFYTKPKLIYDTYTQNGLYNLLVSTNKLVSDIEKGMFKDLTTKEAEGYKDLLGRDINRVFIPAFVNFGGLSSGTKTDWTPSDFIDRKLIIEPNRREVAQKIVDKRHEKWKKEGKDVNIEEKKYQQAKIIRKQKKDEKDKKE